MADLTALRAELAAAEQAWATSEPGSLEMVRASQRVARARLALRAAETGQRVENLW